MRTLRDGKSHRGSSRRRRATRAQVLSIHSALETRAIVLSAPSQRSLSIAVESVRKIRGKGKKKENGLHCLNTGATSVVQRERFDSPPIRRSIGERDHSRLAENKHADTYPGTGICRRSISWVSGHPDSHDGALATRSLLSRLECPSVDTAGVIGVTLSDAHFGRQFRFREVLRESALDACA